MHKAGLITMAIGGVILLISVIMGVVGGSKVGELATNMQPGSKHDWKGTADDSPHTYTAEPGAFQIWAKEGAPAPTIDVTDAEGNSLLQPQNGTLTVNGYTQLGQFVNEGEQPIDVTITVEGEGEAILTKFSMEALEGAAGGVMGVVGGMLGGCLGFAVLIIGLILGLVMKKKDVPPPAPPGQMEQPPVA